MLISRNSPRTRAVAQATQVVHVCLNCRSKPPRTQQEQRRGEHTADSSCTVQRENGARSPCKRGAVVEGSPTIRYEASSAPFIDTPKTWISHYEKHRRGRRKINDHHDRPILPAHTIPFPGRKRPLIRKHKVRPSYNPYPAQNAGRSTTNGAGIVGTWVAGDGAILATLDEHLAAAEHADQSMRTESLQRPAEISEANPSLFLSNNDRLPSTDKVSRPINSAELQPSHFLEEQEAMLEETTETAQEKLVVGMAANKPPPQSLGSRFPWQQKRATPLSASKSAGPKACLSASHYDGIRNAVISAHLYHSSAHAVQQTAAVEVQEEASSIPEVESTHGIRSKLRRWQEVHEGEHPLLEMLDEGAKVAPEKTYVGLSNLPDMSHQESDEDADEDSVAFYASRGTDGYEVGVKANHRFVKPGDLVEIQFPGSERENILAIYVRRVGKSMAHSFTIDGRWMHHNDNCVIYSLSGWIDAKLLEPIIRYLPEMENLSELLLRTKTEDISVPRDISAPLISRLIAFHEEVLQIYRRHASALDNAHDILAHDTDLRYGTITSVAKTLLNIPTDKLAMTLRDMQSDKLFAPALFAVRKAMENGGYAFNVDRRSHRQTGYIQIRSREQVKMVERVRTWIREWQDDLASKASEGRAPMHKPSPGAQIIHTFIQKCRTIIMKQRYHRSPIFKAGNVSPSKLRIPITDSEESIKVELEYEFNESEQDIIKFFELWSCSNMFLGHPRITSLPPLILHAVGLYKDAEDLKAPTGFVFLQELGAIMPHENRVRFDQHLLLPSSQHSKPLQALMGSLEAMREKPNLNDVMAHLRHDWGRLPVYCIDDASAQEIDDGISVEQAGRDENGEILRWLHVHIANPTAFIARDHALAKMARHMGETIYMPERTYMMLPRWVTKLHFSLAPMRPCLTFSAKLDSKGTMLEYRITPGTIRNVVHVTPKEVEELLTGSTHSAPEEVLIVAGGTPPPAPSRRSCINQHTAEPMKKDLTSLFDLAQRRSEIRKKAGGIFFEVYRSEVSVWQSSQRSGLAWDHPHRKGSRTVYGDPVIQLRTEPFQNWFTTKSSLAKMIVSEAMLLCSEIAAKYCAERGIPTIYRGTVPDDRAEVDPKAQLGEELLKQNKELPMHLGVPYLQSLGYTVLRTHPLRHDFLGMDHYAKVTSPLRRYGDMIMHWQIEAALRHEAETGRSLLIGDPKHPPLTTQSGRSFLPFSRPVLENIILGLQPREAMISNAKKYASAFWESMLMFRKHYYPELDGPLPYKTYRVFVFQQPEKFSAFSVPVISMELNIGMAMLMPESFGLEAAEGGDVWECSIEQVAVYRRETVVKPIRLLGRVQL